MHGVVALNLRQVLISAVAALAVGPAFSQESAPRAADPIFAPREDSFIGRLGPAGRFYPDIAARDRIIPGEAVIECILHADATLHECRVISETPRRHGFGEAAQRMARAKILLAAPRLVNGQRVDREPVRMTVPFSPPTAH